MTNLIWKTRKNFALLPWPFYVYTASNNIQPALRKQRLPIMGDLCKITTNWLHHFFSPGEYKQETSKERSRDNFWGCQCCHGVIRTVGPGKPAESTRLMCTQHRKHQSSFLSYLTFLVMLIMNSHRLT